jgi:hypothetical protein
LDLDLALCKLKASPVQVVRLGQLLVVVWDYLSHVSTTRTDPWSYVSIDKVKCI